MFDIEGFNMNRNLLMGAAILTLALSLIHI